MTRSIKNRKCPFLCLLSLAIAGTSASGAAGAKVREGSQAAATYARTLTAANDRLALEAYEKRNAGITPWAEYAVPTITDNAALLYYQACLFVPEPNKAIRYQIRPNAGPTKQIITYLGHCLPVIEMVETASRIPRCDWAVWPEGRPTWEPLTLKLGLIHEVLLMDATTLAVDGHYRVALDRCLTVRRIARHLSDDPELYRFQRAPDIEALYTIRILLGMMPPDVDILTWFQGRLAVTPGPQMSLPRILRALVKVQIDGMTTNPDHLLGLRKMAISVAEGEQAKENIRNLIDEQFRSRARNGLAQLIDSISKIIGSEVAYEQKLSQMHEFFDEMMEDDATDPIVKSFISPSGMNMEVTIDRSYSFYVEHEARVNGTKAGVEVYLILAKTGRLPEKLPDYLPKDPSTGQDFGYEITDEGFVLRCQSKEFLKHDIRLSLEFNVHK